MQLRSQRLEEIFVAKALAAPVDDQPMTHAQLIVPSEDWSAIQMLLAWDVDLHHTLPHDPYMGPHKMPPDCEVVPPINELLSTSMTVKPCACPALAAAQPPAPDPMQIQSTVEDHVLAGIRLPGSYSLP